MSKLNFDDGVSIETGGPLRIIHLKDGYYVTGEGYLIPCADREEAQAELAFMEGGRKGEEKS